MKKFDNYVYMLICEITLKLYKETNCMNHSSYCNLMKVSLKDGVLSKRESRHISVIAKTIERVFHFSNKESSEYIINYFMLNKFEKFEESVRLVNEYYPNSGEIF